MTRKIFYLAILLLIVGLFVTLANTSNAFKPKGLDTATFTTGCLKVFNNKLK